jgi:hypothetical protein
VRVEKDRIVAVKSKLMSVPAVNETYRALRRGYARLFSVFFSTEQTFTRIYRKNRWGGVESVSGRGSDPDQTARIIRDLPTLLHALEIRRLLDIPCGDYRWMSQVNLGGIDYVGADVVEAIVVENRRRFAGTHVRFEKANLITDPLPGVDLVLCRDCLVHLSYADVFAAFRQMCESRSRFLLTTTFTARETNQDILSGEWRTLNLEKPPFDFPPPQQVLNEGCTEAGGAFADKSLALWHMKDVERVLVKNGR